MIAYLILLFNSSLLFFQNIIEKKKHKRLRLKGALSGLRQLLPIENAFKVDRVVNIKLFFYELILL